MTEKTNIRTRNFTLVELLVVIVIISIILSMTAPAFRRLMVGNSVDSAARMVSSQLMLARAEAIAKRRYVAVIMPSDINIPSSNNEVYKCQAFRSAYVSESGSNWTLGEWVPGTQWTFLPSGAVIAAIDDDHGSIEYNSTANEWEIVSSWTPTDNCATVGDRKHKEDPDNPDSDDVLDAPIIEGVSTNSNIRAVIFKPNGRALKREYITIMEGICTANNADIERANQNNINVIEINAYTGQARYIYTGK